MRDSGLGPGLAGEPDMKRDGSNPQSRKIKGPTMKPELRDNNKVYMDKVYLGKIGSFNTGTHRLWWFEPAGHRGGIFVSNDKQDAIDSLVNRQRSRP